MRGVRASPVNIETIHFLVVLLSIYVYHLFPTVLFLFEKNFDKIIFEEEARTVLFTTKTILIFPFQDSYFLHGRPPPPPPHGRGPMNMYEIIKKL
jgi:hypothetical protein